MEIEERKCFESILNKKNPENFKKILQKNQKLQKLNFYIFKIKNVSRLLFSLNFFKIKIHVWKKMATNLQSLQSLIF